MGIGVSILLIAAGLILALAVHVTVSGLDIQVVGWILVAAGVLGLVLEFALFAPRRRYAARDYPVRDPDATRVVEERRTYDDRGRY
jgi:Domain of unknown function (DUF6458)